jgi:hypothetical protein
VPVLIAVVVGHLGEAGAVPSAFYTALCVVTAASALPFAARLGAGPVSPTR